MRAPVDPKRRGGGVKSATRAVRGRRTCISYLKVTDDNLVLKGRGRAGEHPSALAHAPEGREVVLTGNAVSRTGSEEEEQIRKTRQTEKMHLGRHVLKT